MAPFFEAASSAENLVYRYLREVVRALDLYNAPVPGDTSIPSFTLPAADIGGRLATQHDVTHNVRANTGTFWVMAEEDVMADCNIAKKTYEADVRNDGLNGLTILQVR